MAEQWFKLNADQEERARHLIANLTVTDALGGAMVYPEPHPVDGKSYLDRQIEAGYRAVTVTLAAHADELETAMVKMYGYFSLLTAKPDKTLHIKRSADMLRAREEGKVGVIFGFQTSTPIGPHIWRWTILHQLGLRQCQLTYMERNIFADGCLEPENRGLTAYGRQAIGEMNRLGIVVDLSHLGERSSLEAIEYSTDPVVFSHSNPLAIGPSARNITDEQIKNCASRGGVIGMTPHSELSHKQRGVRPTLPDYLDHIDYVAQLVGTEHVAIGTDVYESYTKVSWEAQTKRMYKSQWIFETMLTDGFSRIEGIHDVVRGLVSRDYSDDDIRNITGDNWLRVFGSIWDKDPSVA